MWSNGADTNEHNESVLLLQPITGKQKKSAPAPSSSHIGGLPSFYPDDESPFDTKSTICSVCNEQMHLLLQLNAPLDDLDRTLYVFGCNKPSCHYSSTDGNEGKFHINFDGSAIRCFRSQKSPTKVARSPVQVAAPTQKLEDNDWGDDNGWGSGSDDDWGAASSSAQYKINEVSMDDLEAMLTKVEVQSKKTSSTHIKLNERPQSANDNTKKQVGANAPSFRRYNLELFSEPPNAKQSDSMDDEDDDWGSNNIDSSKVNQLLSKYLATEDDEEILSALKGGGSTNTGYGGNNTGGGEKYERLPPEERAFLAFSTRLKRAPLQVVRYAYDGVPLWSIPSHEPKWKTDERKASPKKSNKSTQKHNATIASRTVPPVPPCTCGSQRVFEFQLLPSLLHVLDVDSSAGEVDESMDLNSVGGMNWGSIAVYSCPISCDDSREEVCIVQIGDEVVQKKMEEVGNAGDGGSDDDSMEE